MRSVTIATRLSRNGPPGRRTRAIPAPGDLCCGLAGRAYALLNLHRAGGDRLWLARARDLAGQAVTSVRENALRRDSLYKGDIGVAALIADLDRPDDAAMPFYDRDA